MPRHKTVHMPPLLVGLPEPVQVKVFENVMGGGFICPNNKRAVCAWADKSDDKFICKCGRTHTKRLCESATLQQVIDADGF